MPRSIPMNNYQLIGHIKIRRALWDNSLWDRIDSAAREVMWEDIAEQMKCTKEIIKARWKNLKDSYRKLLVKTMNQSTETIPKWRYYSHLEFIKNIILNTKSKVNDISLRDDSLFSNQDYIIQIENGDENESEDPLALSNDFDDVKVNISKKRRYSEEVEIEFEKPDSPERNASNYPNDDDLQFLLSLYPHFKQVPHNKKLPLRIKIEKMIYDELYK